MKYYLSANTDQVYSALTNNAVTSVANTFETLRHKTFGFMSKEFMLLTKGLVPEEVRRWQTDDVFFSVAMEFDFATAKYIPAYLIVSEGDEIVLRPELADLREAPENTVAAFVCGEIPITFLSAILFETEENKVRFRKPSSDLWFPEDLYAIIGEDIPGAGAALSVEKVAELSEMADSLLSEEDKAEIASVINKRNRFKAVSYFALRETQHWQMDNLKTNVDFYILYLLDRHKDTNGQLYKAFSEYLVAQNQADPNISTIDKISEMEDVLLPSKKYELDKLVLTEVLKWFYTFDKEKTTIDRESIAHIRELVPDAKARPLFDTITDFLTSTYMNPEKALAKLGRHPVFKALMKFLDSSDNDAFMNRGCEGLNQYERRYAYMMFAAIKGMSFVEREWKSNVNLELRLEEIAMARFSAPQLISCAATTESKFCATGKALYGIEFTVSYWMGKQATLSVLSDATAKDKLQAVYDIVARDKSMKLEKLKSFETPCRITISCGGLTRERSAANVDELKKIVKDTKLVNEINKKVKTKTDLDAFRKKYILDDAWYDAVFEKYCLEIQRICRSHS